MEERIRFVLQAAREELGFAELCRQFGISRKTGYKWWRRYQAGGLAGMHEGSRRPRGSPTRLAPAVVTLILRERSRHGSWGPKKLRQVLATKHGITPVSPGMQKSPPVGIQNSPPVALLTRRSDDGHTERQDL
jgi:transposase-like protein